MPVPLLTHQLLTLLNKKGERLSQQQEFQEFLSV
jgi:hypothetical protein